MHLDTSESSLEIKVLGQSTVENRCYLYVVIAYVMHTLLIRSHTLCTRYLYAGIRYAYGDKRYNDGPSSIARVSALWGRRGICLKLSNYQLQRAHNDLTTSPQRPNSVHTTFTQRPVMCTFAKMLKFPVVFKFL